MRKISAFLFFVSLILVSQVSAQAVNGLYVISNESIQELDQLQIEGEITFELSGVRDVFAVYAHDLHPQLEEYIRYRYQDFEAAVAVFRFPAHLITDIFENDRTLSPGYIGEDSINERFVTDSLPVLRYPTQPVTQYDSGRAYAFDIYVEYDKERVTHGRLYHFGGSGDTKYWEITLDKISDELPSALQNLSFSGRHTAYWLAESWSKLR